MTMNTVRASLLTVGLLANSHTAAAMSCADPLEIISGRFHSEEPLTARNLAAGLYHNYFKVPELQSSEHIAIGTFELNPELKDEHGNMAGVEPYNTVRLKTNWAAPTRFVGIDYSFHDGIWFSGVFFSPDGTEHDLKGDFDLKLHCDEYCAEPPRTHDPIFYKLNGPKPEYFRINGSMCDATFAPSAQPEVVTAFRICMRDRGCKDWLYGSK
ncbi:hypothetical protein [Parasedimentitalea huanghaiensis]|uniref:Uncharacterized protein n=1 Tax=Parasedimentitalea huanghaiensis TaxID=2682100 RepID=A0A6L6WDY1_9RHOB|nr:hypothetical protein [Zongyanglinia huanghaiensis]MVO15451.1 hypothetical protein [Zongyanglinia huanghaiensis]